MNRKEIKAKIRENRSKMRSLHDQGQKTDNLEELRKINSQMDELRSENFDLEDKLDDLDDGTGEARGSSPVGRLNVLGTYGIGQRNQEIQGSEERMSKGVFGSLEYRQAFMDFVLTGARSELLEQRANATTLTSDIGTVIPTSIMNKVYEKMSAYSMIWNRITKTNVKGGVAVPISSLKPTASWVAENSVAETQKKTTASITFNYYKLQCRVAISLEADTVSLEMFESTLVENIYEAMIIAAEKSVISGTGVGQPLGIVNDSSIPAGQIIDVTAAEIGQYDTWNNIVSHIPLAYEAKVDLTLTKKDWDKYIAGMIDANGQPIARVNLGIAERPERRVLGYNAVLVDDYLTSFDAANVGDIFGFIVDYRDYIYNSNLKMMYKKYFDENTDQFIHKATELADGKLAAPHSVILLRKAV